MFKDYLTYVLYELDRGNKDYASLILSEAALKHAKVLYRIQPRMRW